MPHTLATLRLHPSEKKALDAVARERGQTISAVIRGALARDAVIPPRETDASPDRQA